MKQILVTLLLAAGIVAGLAGIPLAASDELDRLPRVTDLPEGVIQVSPAIPGMGEHWADPKTLPLGPIYCVIEGRVTCMEYMISQQDFADGKSFENLRPWFKGPNQPAVHHMEFNFEPQGHEGFEVPHYDIHMYFVSPEVRLSQK